MSLKDKIIESILKDYDLDKDKLTEISKIINTVLKNVSIKETSEYTQINISINDIEIKLKK